MTQAFGLAVEAGYEVGGLAPGRPAGGRAVRLELGGDISFPEPAARIAEFAVPGGRGFVAASPGEGFLMHAEGFGSHRLSPAGDVVRSAPPAGEPWVWQRFLFGQVLPFCALLQGLEVFHASAVTLDGEALAFVGPSGAGKSSLAAALVLGGAGFLTDDVVAIEDAGGMAIAHPGPSLANLRRAGAGVPAQLATRSVGSDDGLVPLCLLDAVPASRA